MASELFSLQGVLQYIDSVRKIQAGDDVYKYDASAFQQLLDDTEAALGSLREALEVKKSPFERVVQRGTWTFRKTQVQEHFAKLERLKASFLVVGMGDGL